MPPKQSQFESTEYNNLIRARASGIYYGQWRVAGRQTRTSLKTRSLKMARRKLASLYPKVLKKGASATGDGNAKFATVAEDWRQSTLPTTKAHARKSYIGSIKHLKEFFPGVLSRITKRQCEKWFAVRSVRKASTANGDLRVLQRIFDYAVAHDIVMDNPAAHIKKKPDDSKEVEIPTEDEFQKLIAELRNQQGEASEATEFLAASGCRDAELLGDTEVETKPMYWGAFEWNFGKLGRLKIRGKGRKKDGKIRYIPIFPPLRKLVDRMIARLGHQPKPTERIFNIEHIAKQIDRACIKAGIRHTHPHAMRHLFCSRAIASGVDFLTIAAWLGHTDKKGKPDATEIMRTYGHLRADNTETAALLMIDMAEEPPLPANVVRMVQPLGAIQEAQQESKAK